MHAQHRTTLTGQHTTTVLAREDLTPSAYILHLDRQGLDFIPGHCVVLGCVGKREQREYSIFSPTTAPDLAVLIKEVEQGRVSHQLRQCKPGEPVLIEGPVGFFTLDDVDIQRDRVLFVASGTGIAPFHCMVGSRPGMDYRILHGVRTSAEAYGRATFDPARHVLCTSREEGGTFSGRVTDYLRGHPVAPETRCFLCGNVRMIDEVYDILANQGVPADNIRAEVFF
ncbi:MAG: oxidoreductase [Lentisphaerae bacterium]|nr:oxidoreductase [Lentisphaerota bacterium]